MRVRGSLLHRLSVSPVSELTPRYCSVSCLFLWTRLKDAMFPVSVLVGVFLFKAVTGVWVVGKRMLCVVQLCDVI